MKDYLSKTIKPFLAILLVTFLFSEFITVNAEGNESVVIEQVGTSGGLPAISAAVKNGRTAGTYSLILTNPVNGTIHSQVLPNDGKSVTYVPNNFDTNGTYKYTLQLAGIEVASGGVNLVSSKRTPDFVAVINGKDLAIDIRNATDYIGQVISFESGTFTGKFDVTGPTMQRAFGDVTGATDKITFTGPVGQLVTVDLKKGNLEPLKPEETGLPQGTGGSSSNNNSSTTEYTQPGNSGITNGGSTNNGSTTGSNNSQVPTTSNGNSSPAPTTETNTSNDIDYVETVPSTPGSTTNTNGQTQPTQSTSAPQGKVTVSSSKENINKNLKLTLNKQSFELEELMVVDVEILDREYASQSITLRLEADKSSETTLLTLGPDGTARATFKFDVPQPSSKSIVATTYSIGGSKLDTVAISYVITNEVPGQGAALEDENEAKIDYMALDLTTLDKKKALLSWYGAKNIFKYDTRLKVINNTTGDTRTYSVYIPDGESKINLNLTYDGPGIYTWELYVEGKKLIQSPYSTPVNVDPTPVSQNGLPVLKTLPNKNIQNAHLDGTDPNLVSGANLGEEIGGFVADDFTQTDIETQEAISNSQQSGNNKLLLILVLVFVVLGASGFLFWRKKQAEKDAEDGFKPYDGDDDDDFDEDEPLKEA